MPLRHPVYLDAETLNALADYYELATAPSKKIVEKSTKKSSAGIAAPFGITAQAGLGKSIEFQSSYTITPSEKASVSKVIDGLIASGNVVTASPDATLAKDYIAEVEGNIRLTAASLAGKMFYVLKKYLESIDQNIIDLNFVNIEPEVMQIFQSIYLGNELVSIPILVDIVNSGFSPRILANLRPNMFVDSATSNQIEGERRVLGTVRTLIKGGDDGYLSTEEWLFPNWEYLMKRVLMTKVNNFVKELIKKLDIEFPAEDVDSWIKGPAVILDTIAIY